MFAHTNLSKQQVELLRTEYHIYIMSTGRISLPACRSSPKLRNLYLLIICSERSKHRMGGWCYKRSGYKIFTGGESESVRAISASIACLCAIIQALAFSFLASGWRGCAKSRIRHLNSNKRSLGMLASSSSLSVFSLLTERLPVTCQNPQRQ